MAQTRFKVAMAKALVAVLLVQSLAQQQPPCTPAIVSLSPCLGFITGNLSAPSSVCCTQLASVVQLQAQCLCTFLSTGATQLGFKINQTQALTLPGACNIQTPPLSQCNAVAGAPVASPQGAPAAVTPSLAPLSSDLAPTTPSAPSKQSPSIPSVPTVPTASSPASPSAPTTGTPSESGSKTVPAKSGQSAAAGSSTNFVPSIFFFVLLVASTFSSF